MKVLVTGSREWTDAEAIARRLYALSADEVEIIHGNCRGADLIAANEAEALGYKVTAFPADWDRHGKRAGILRNLVMLDQAPDLVLAFRIDGSRGTTHCIEAAKARGICVEVIEL